MERGGDDVISQQPMQSENLHDNDAEGVDVGDLPMQDMLSRQPAGAVADVVQGVVGDLVQEIVEDDEQPASMRRALRLALLFLAICFSMGGYFIFLSFFDCHSVCQEILARNIKTKMQHSTVDSNP